MKTKINNTYSITAKFFPGIGFAIGRQSWNCNKKTVVDWNILLLCFSIELTITKFKFSGDRVTVQCRCEEKQSLEAILQ